MTIDRLKGALVAWKSEQLATTSQILLRSDPHILAPILQRKHDRVHLQCASCLRMSPAPQGDGKSNVTGPSQVAPLARACFAANSHAQVAIGTDSFAHHNLVVQEYRRRMPRAFGGAWYTWWVRPPRTTRSEEAPAACHSSRTIHVLLPPPLPLTSRAAPVCRRSVLWCDSQESVTHQSRHATTP